MVNTEIKTHHYVHKTIIKFALCENFLKPTMLRFR